MPRAGTKLSANAKAKNVAAIKAWHDENTTKITIRVRKEKHKRYKELAERRGKSLSSLIQEFLDAECEKETQIEAAPGQMGERKKS